MKSILPPRSRILAIISGLLGVIACPPFNLFPIGWFALVPLFLSLENPRRGGFGEGFTAGLVFNSGLLYWLALNNGTHFLVATATMVATVLVISLGWGCASWLFVRIRNTLGKISWLLAPVSWAVWEGWLSNLGELAFPWPLMALTQAEFNPILQIMEFTGVWGVSFWVVAVNVALYITWFNRKSEARYRSLLVFVILVMIPMIAMMHAKRYERIDLPHINVAVVQGAIKPHEKWVRGFEYSWSSYDSLTRACAEAEPDLIVWPETSMPVHLMHRSVAASRITDLAAETNSWLILGASDYFRINEMNKPVNSAFLIKPGTGIIEKFGKRFLVPFGERVPFQGIFPSLGKLNFGQAEFLRGSRLTIFEMPVDYGIASFPVMICYESVAPWITRRAAETGANFLVTMSNDAWYGRSSQPSQIAALSRFRCIETRRSMARASNTGFSALIDQFGREIKRTRLFERTWLSYSLPLCDFETFYVKHGDVFLSVISIIYGAGLLLTLIVGRWRNRSEYQVAETDKAA